MKDKICALIRQTWYETAKKNLQPAERLRFYEICLEYEFNDVLPDEDAPFAARLLFDMVRNDIDEDKTKAKERAERSRRNGAAGGRPKVTPSNNGEQNPENPAGYFKPVYTNTSTQQEPKHNKRESDDSEDTHMFFNVALLFFEKGCSDPCGEANTFWNYYEAMGWQTKGGGVIKDRMALAKAWRLSDCSRQAMRSRAPYADLMHKANPVEISLLADFVSMSRNASAETVEIVLQERATAILLDEKYMPALQQWIPRREDGSPYSLKYKALHVTLD